MEEDFRLIGSQLQIDITGISFSEMKCFMESQLLRKKSKLLQVMLKPQELEGDSEPESDVGDTYLAYDYYGNCRRD